MNLLTAEPVSAAATHVAAPASRWLRRAASGALACVTLLVSAAAAALAAPQPNRIVNFSVRAPWASGEQTVILGFSVDGYADGLLLRAVGPTLETFGVHQPIADPQLSLFWNNRIIASNDDWGASAVAPATGAFPLLAGSKDAALLRFVQGGNFTAHVGNAGQSGGVVLAEFYDAQRLTNGRVTNVSARGFAGSGEASFIAGLTVSGTGKRPMLLRAIGPGLAAAGLQSALSDPKIELFETGASGPFAINDNWSDDTAAQAAMTQTGAAVLPVGSKDAALLLNLGPGSYTARISGADGGTGVALFEVFDAPTLKLPLTSAGNVVYQHGDFITYRASGEYRHANGSKTVITGGWLRLEIVDEGVKNPLNQDLPVMSLVETQLYAGEIVSASGAATPVRVVGYPTTRYYVQDEHGTILYQGEKLPAGTDANGELTFQTYWFQNPKDYVQYQAPFVVGADKVTEYAKQSSDGATTKLGRTETTVETTETVAVPLGSFDTYRVRLLETSQDAGAEGTPIASRTQNIYPDIGIVKFNFYSVTPGDTGEIVMALSDTNLPYLGGRHFQLSEGDYLRNVQPGQVTKFGRSGYYISADGTIEEIRGWFTMEVFDEGVINPLTNRPALTLLETHHTEIEATTLAGEVTHSTTHQAFKRYVVINEIGQTAFSGDTGPDGAPIWFEGAFVPLPFPYSIGQTKTETITAKRLVDGQPTPIFSYTPTMKVVSVVPIRTLLGTFDCYRMTYEDTNGYRAEQYDYPAIGAVRFSYPAPPGKSGHMELTLSSINYALPSTNP